MTNRHAEDKSKEDKPKTEAHHRSVTSQPRLWPLRSFSIREYGLVVVGLLAVAGGIATFAASPPPANNTPVGNPTYINVSQILPGSKISFYDQPWRAYMKTVPATTLLNGMGTTYIGGAKTPAALDSMMQYLSSIGVRSIRKEVSWSSVSATDESQFTAGSNLAEFLADCKKYNMIPDLLLNANDGDPEPNFPNYKGKVVVSSAVGATQVRLSGVAAANVVVHKMGTATGGSGISDNTGTEARYMITKVTTDSDGSLTLGLSHPLVNALAAGTTIPVQYLEYMPLFPVGSPEFNHTMVGWNQYVTDVGNAVKTAGLPYFRAEIWNEMTFGSALMNANKYFTPGPNSSGAVNAKMQPGGFTWELANQTTQKLKSMFGNNVAVDWGFSNSDFYETGIPNLPPNTDAESFHPGGAGLISLSKHAKDLNQLVEGPYIPISQGKPLSQEMPEGTYAQGWQPLNLIRGKLAKAGTKLPPGTTNFGYWFTEAGYSPQFGGQKFSTTVNQQLKAKAVLRQYSFWLNKGLSLYDFGSPLEGASKGDTDGGSNILAYQAQTGADPTTLQSQAIQHFSAQFAGATTISQPRSLGVSVTDTTPNDNTSDYQVFQGDSATKEPALNYREMFQFLPFQVTNSKFVIPTYVQSWNITNPPPPMDFQVDITNVSGQDAQVSYYDPIANAQEPVTIVRRGMSDIVVNIECTDSVRLLSITESGSGGGSGGSGGATAPTVALSTPSAGATLNGKTATLTATATNASSVQFELDGNKIGPALTTAPYTYQFDTTTIPNGKAAHILSVIATGASGISSTASESVFVSNADATPPSTPTLTHDAITATTAKLRWNKSTDNTGGSGVAGYHLYRNGKLVATTSDIAFVDSGLKPSTSYTYTVASYDNAGNSSPLSGSVTLSTKSQ